jgi:hypothetical protein
VVEGFRRDAGKCECCCVVEHRVIEAENIHAREVCESPDVIVESVQVILDTALILIQDGSRDAGILGSDATSRRCPG